METIEHMDTFEYLDIFAPAVVPRRDYYVDFDELESLDDEDSTAFEVYFINHNSFYYKPVDLEGSLGMILFLDDFTVPEREFPYISVRTSLPFKN
jgi:hypothetical protein